MHQQNSSARTWSVRVRSIRRSLGAVACVTSALSTLAACQPKSDAAQTESARAMTQVPGVQSTPLPVDAPSAWSLNEMGYGPIVAGMTYAAANDSLKGALKAAKNANLAECDYVTWEGGPAGLGIMVVEGKIARVDVGDNTDIRTKSGAQVGDTEDRIKSLYGNRVKVTDHKYEDGHYLTVRSAIPTDTLHFIIFETSNGKVTRMRGGAMPGVEYVEGCS